MRCILPLLALSVLPFFSDVAAAQTTRPAQLVWPEAVTEFSRALLSSHEPTITGALTDSASIRRFDSDKPKTAATLLEDTRHAVLVGAHGYIGPASTLADDLADDFQAAQQVPESVRQKMAVPEDATDRVNSIAEHWIADTLHADKETPVGVVALWSTDPSPHVIFVLIKGQEVAPGRFRIASIVFGQPKSAR